MQVEFGHRLPSGQFIRMTVSSNEITALANRYGNIDCYASLLGYTDIDDSNAALWGPFALDLDSSIKTENDFDKIRKEALSAISYLKLVLRVPKQAIQCYFSGCKGFHIVTPAELWFSNPSPNMHQYYRTLAAAIKRKCNLAFVDMSLYDWRHLFRLPHTINSKSGLYKVEITHEELRRISYKQLCTLAMTDRTDVEDEQLMHASYNLYATSRGIARSIVEQEKRSSASLIRSNTQSDPNMKSCFNKEITPPCVTRLLTMTREAGSRNIVTCLLASYYNQLDMTLTHAIDKLIEWNNEQCSPPLPRSEVVATVRSIYGGAKRYKYGCTSFAEYGGCSETCPLKQKNDMVVRAHR